MAQATWTVDPKPILDIRGLGPSGSVNFNSPAGAMRLSNGSILLADRSAFAVRLFDAKGKLVKTTGRKGQGPNEFRSLGWGGPCGADTLIVWDSGANLATLIGANGDIATQIRIPADSGVHEPMGGGFACAKDGRIAYPSAPIGRSKTSEPDHLVQLVSVIVVDRGGHRLTQVDSLIGIEARSINRNGTQQPLSRSALAVSVGDQIVFGSSDTTALSVMRPNGSITTMDLPIRRRAPTREEYEVAARALVNGYPTARADLFLKMMLAFPLPDRLPAYMALFSDPAGMVWAQLSPTGSKPVELVAYRLDGRPAGRVVLPYAATIHEIGREYILASYSDEDDETHLAVFRLVRTMSP